MKKIKFGVVGTVRGLTFVKLLQVFGEQVCLHAVCENNAEKAEAIKQEIPENIRVYSDYDEFLASGIEAVVLCNFFHEHAQALQVGTMGIAVFYHFLKSHKKTASLDDIGQKNYMVSPWECQFRSFLFPTRKNP